MDKTQVTIEQALANLKAVTDEVDRADREDTVLRNRLAGLRRSEEAARKELSRTIVIQLGRHEAVGVLHALAVELKRELVDPIEPHPSRVKAVLMALLALIDAHSKSTPSAVTYGAEQVRKELGL